MNKIKKVLIPCAGLGTRFLPSTKSLPKEMFPIIDKPNLQYIVEEATKSGIKDIGIIVSEAKPIIVNHFSRDEKLEDLLLKANKQKEIELIEAIGSMAKITFIYQKEPLGLGHAILQGEEFINGEDFAIMLGDDLIINYDDPSLPALKQLVEAYDKTSSSILGVQEVPLSNVSKYGIVDIKDDVSPLMEVKKTIEKPSLEDAPSRYAVLGRYVLTNNIFSYLKKVKKGKNGEIGLTEAIDMLLKDNKVYAYKFEGKRYDIGSKAGYVEAFIDLALSRDDLKDEISQYIKSLKL